MKILLVDDSEDTRTSEKNILTEIGYTDIVEAEDCMDAVEKLQAERADIILLDWNMQKMDGITFLKGVRGIEALKDIPVIMLTAEGSNESIVEAIKAGVNGYLTKPLKPQTLREKINKVIKTERIEEIPHIDEEYVPEEIEGLQEIEGIEEIVDAAEEYAGEGEKRSGPKRILLVDDSKVIHHRVGGALKKEGYEVINAHDGAEGIKMVTRVKPDLVITDIEMPKKNGYEVCKFIKEHQPTQHIPVMISSSLGSGIDVDRGFEVGANEYLVKPVMLDELFTTVESMLESAEMNRNENILVVDDSLTVINMLKIGLKQQGFQVLVAMDGEEAYEKATENVPDLIILDLVLPKMEGDQVIQYLKEHEETKDIPIIIISSRESAGNISKAKKLGASACVSKPFTIDKIIVLVERMLMERRLMREKEAMKRYISDAAAEAARQSALDKGGGERKTQERVMTVLFSDIVGFTPKCENLHPKEVVEFLNEYFDVMTVVLKERGAMIDKFIGDAIMALFGSREADNGPENAVRSGLGMLHALEKYNKEHDESIKIRIGINTGPVIMGDIGSRHHRRDYTVIGDTVNTAQRLETKCPHNGVLISESTYEDVQDLIRATPLEPLSVKGRKDKVQAYVVEGLLK